MFGRLPYRYILSLSQSNLRTTIPSLPPLSGRTDPIFRALPKRSRTHHLVLITFIFTAHTNRTEPPSASPEVRLVDSTFKGTVPTSGVCPTLIALQEMISLCDQPPSVPNGRTHHIAPPLALDTVEQLGPVPQVNARTGNVSKLPCLDGISVMLKCQTRSPCSLSCPLVSSTCQSIV